MTKNLRVVRAAAFAATAVSAAAASAAPIDLSGKAYVQYGDAQSYSLPAAGIDVNSSPGQIENLVVVATGTNGSPVVTNFSGMDNAYATPNSGSSTFFRTSAGTSQGTQGVVNNNGADTWDASLLALKSFLAGNAMVLYFNNNQQNSLGAAAQSLAAWLQIRVKDPLGTSVGIYDLTNNNGKYALFTEGGGGTLFGDVTSYTSDGSGPDGNSNANTDYVLSGGAICANSSNVGVSCSSPDAVGQPLNHNLGANNAAYAILFPELNSQLQGLFALSDATLQNYTLSLDLRLGCDPGLFGLPGTNREPNVLCTGTDIGHGKDLNNGYEQLFIGTAVPTSTPVPEPASLALVGLGLAALGSSRRKTRC